MNGIPQIEMVDELGEIVGVSVHVVALPRLARATVAASIMRDAAVAVRSEEEHLVLEGVGAKRPAVAEHDRLSLAPIVVIDVRAVLGRDRAHRCVLAVVEQTTPMSGERASRECPVNRVA
jgi:hypothetical protein